MTSISPIKCQINTDDVALIGNNLKREKFIQQAKSSSFIRSNLSSNIQVDLSQSFEFPSIICCCSTVETSLPKLLSSLNPNSSSTINLVVFIQSSDIIDWNSLMKLIILHNLSLNIVNDENNLRKKLIEIIDNLAKDNKKKSISNHVNNGISSTDIQVK